MSAFRVSLVIWSAWAALFVVLEFLAVFDVVPWNTLSWTAWQLQALSGLFSIAFAAGLFVLLLHIVLPGRWPRRGTGYPKRDEPEGRN